VGVGVGGDFPTPQYVSTIPRIVLSMAPCQGEVGDWFKACRTSLPVVTGAVVEGAGAGAAPWISG